MNSYSKTLLMLLIGSVSSFSAAQTREIAIPDVPGFVTLKCDFHMHTVFSDGHVWPTFRVNEAVRDGLDAISLTEHIDYEGFPEVVDRDYNKSYEIAREAADKKGLIVIRGAEISPRVPPYHNNALFLTDANIIPSEYMKDGKKKFVMKDSITHDELMGPFLEVQRQGAFVSYNHPGYAWWDKKDTAIFTSFHHELLEKGILNGVEVVNSGRYNILAHKLAIKYDLTMLCNTDEHYDMYPRYADSHRPMTLVFAKERSEEGIKEALFAKRTALYFGDYIVARQPEAEGLFKASVTATSKFEMRNGEPILKVTLENHSSIPFETMLKADYDVELFPLGQVKIPAKDSVEVILKSLWDYPAQVKLDVAVMNVLISPGEALKTDFILDSKK
ncbi:Sb-PDE family phosphodiesterase [Algoriphagus terrigena]|uniref:Sb-PDE family phosphodiesterase n=1 Tax=Algoriphagus terrigena TaxID=344884 RepID=UPI000424A75B|nr:Sb-PDE family phosphodiesterase [Algoriphagus terrigena]